MKRSWLRVFALVLAILTLPAFRGVLARAATFEDVNGSGVFLKQETNYTCTLSSAAMLIRRAAMMNGRSDWASVTETALKSAAWVSAGLKHSFSYAGVTVGHAFSEFDRNTLAALLADHPEGIVAYNGGRSNQWHAILLTDYTDGVFYCADPATGDGRKPFAQCTLRADGEDGKIALITAYWYVTSAVAPLTRTPYTVSYDANGGSGAPRAQTGAGSSLALSTAVPAREGYTFAGWTTASDGSGTIYAPGALYAACESVTLYARWSTVLAGDANGDGTIDNKDVVRLKNYLSNYDAETGLSTVDLSAFADANGDGIVSNKDVVRLKNYFSHFDQTTGYSSVVLGPA